MKKTKQWLNRLKQKNLNQREESMSVKRWHPVVVRKIQEMFLIEVKDLTTGNQMAEVILPDLEAVKRFLEGAFTDAGKIEETADVHGD